MPRRIIRVILPLLALPVLVACGTDAASTDTDFQWHGAVSDGQWLRLRNLKGDVTIEASTDGQVQVSGHRVTHGVRAEQVEFATINDANGVVLCALHGRRGHCGASDYRAGGGGIWDRLMFRSGVDVAWEIRVPAGVKVDVSDVNGSVKIAGVTSDVIANTINGSVKASTTAGSIHARSVNGNVVVDMAGTGALTDVDLKTVNGSVTATLPDNVAAAVEMGTVNGLVESQFAVTSTGKINRHRLVGTIGTGGAPVSLKTVNGSVTLRKRA